nr:hypothetical protein CFP56_46098 [Quercus suber]
MASDEKIPTDSKCEGKDADGLKLDEVAELPPRKKAKTELKVYKRRMRTSNVWSYFQILPPKAEGKPTCKCKKCGKEYMAAGADVTENLKRHLDWACPRKFDVPLSIPHSTVPDKELAHLGPLAELTEEKMSKETTEFAMSLHYFYIYFDREAYINDLHGLSYRGSNQKQALIEVKHGIHMRKLKRKIMSTLALDKDSHDISIVFRAPQQMCDNDVDIMWGVIKRAPQFIGSDLYVTIDTVGFNVDGGSQYASNAGQQESVPVTIMYPTVTAETSLPYNVGPYNAVAMENIEDAEVYTHGNEDIQTNFDDTIEMDDTRDMYEEFIDNDGPEDNPEFLNEVEVENNMDACPNPNPIPDWFTSNTWDNIHDPSPSMETGLMSWRSGDEPSKGMLFLNKAAVQHALTMFSVGLNKKFKYMKSDPKRLVVTCVEDACPWSVRAINSKRRKLWEITTCKGPYTCSSLQVDHDGRMMDSKFIVITLESYVREDISRTIATLRSLLHAKHDHWASHYKVWDAKHKAVAAIYGDFDESYAELPRFLAALKDADPTIVTQLKCNNRNVLETCTVSHRYHTYELVFQPLKDRLAWPDPEETRVVIPNPRLIQKKGWPKSTRIRNEKDEDDNDRELPGSLWIENGPKSRCGLCHQEGHNRRTCPTRNAESTSGGDAS